MNRNLVHIFIIIVLTAALAVGVQAAEPVTASLSMPEASAGDLIIVSGTADSNVWVTVKIVDDYSSIVFFDAVRSGLDGAYSCSFVVPDGSIGTLDIIAGYDSNVAAASLVVKESSDPVAAFIQPSSISFSLVTPADIVTFVRWGSTATSVTEVVYGNDTLTIDTDYSVDASKVTVYKEYLSSLNLKAGDTLDFDILLNDSSTLTLAVNVAGDNIPTYSVSYDGNGGTGSGPIESDKAAGAAFAAADNTFTAPEGKRFKEWNTKSDGSGTGYAEGAVVTMPGNDLTLYAIWEDISTEIPSIHPSTVSFDLAVPADIVTFVDWGSSTSSVAEVVYGNVVLTIGSDYSIDASKVTIHEVYLSGLGLKEGDGVTFGIVLNDSSVLTLTVNVVNNYIPSDNADLSGLTLSAGTLTPGFDPAETSYSASVGANVTHIGVTPAAADSKAMVTVNGSSVAQGSTKTVPLNTGDNMITIVVTAENSATKTYEITVNRALAHYESGDSSDRDRSDRGRSESLPAPMPRPAQTSTVIIHINGNTVVAATASLDVRTGTATVVLTADSLSSVLSAAKADEQGRVSVVIEIPRIAGAQSYAAELPAAVLSANANVRLELRSEAGTIAVPGNMLGNGDYGAGSVGLSIGAADISDMDEAVRARIGSKPVVELMLTSGGKAVPWNNPDAPVTVSIPYVPTSEELADPEHIVVWYLDGAGNIVPVTNGKYNPATGMVSFETTHFSKYAVAYVKQSFTDLGSAAWAKKQIEVLAAKGVFSSISRDAFLPNESITRADYLVWLVKTLGITAEFNHNFDDVEPGTYYYEAVGIAQKLGITGGVGSNRFNPNAGITRQDMMVLTVRALEKCKGLKDAGGSGKLDRFKDKESIAGYAVDSMAALVREGFITGSGDEIKPCADTTRAQAAVFLYRIYNKY